MSITVDQYRDNITEHQLQALVLDYLAKKGKPGDYCDGDSKRRQALCAAGAHT